MKFTKSPTAAGIVAGAAFIASAGHIVHVVSETNPVWFALAYPIGIDGLIYVGIRAMQNRRFVSGAIALLIGAVYSLAFNGHAEGAFTMPPLMIASSMPVAMFAAFLIEAIGEPEKEIEAPAAAPQIITKTVAPALLPIVPFAPKPIAPKPTVKAIASPAGRTVFVKDETPKTDGRKTGGRTAGWDVEKAVALIEDGRTNAEVASTVGTNEKAIQRTRRAMKTEGTDAEVATITGLSAAHVARVRAAMKG